MKKVIILFLVVLAVSIAMAKGTTNVTAVVKGKPLEFSPAVRDQVIQKSVALLSSCAYVDPRPDWGAPGQPQSIADAQKNSHLRFVFSNPCQVEVPIEKLTVQVREMVVSLPLVTAWIWVRTDEGVRYFAKFSHAVVEGLQPLLQKANHQE